MKYGPYALALTVSFLSACSPPIDPIGRGGAHFQVDQAKVEHLRGTACGVSGIGGIGSPKPENDHARPGPPDLPVSGGTSQPSNMGSKATDGEKSSSFGTYVISCRVSGTKNYIFEADLEGPNTSEYAPETSGVARIVANGTIDAETGTGTGSVGVRTTESSMVTPSENAICNYTVLTDTKDASVYRIGPGRVDLTFVCQDATPTTSPQTRCETRGTITLDNCIED